MLLYPSTSHAEKACHNPAGTFLNIQSMCSHATQQEQILDFLFWEGNFFFKQCQSPIFFDFPLNSVLDLPSLGLNDA